MTGIVTHRFRYANALNFKNMFRNNGENGDNMYFFIGRTQPWPDDALPPNRKDSVNDVRFEPWKNFIGMKKIANNGVTFATTRYDWSAGTRYRQYSHLDSFIYSNTTPFFTLTPDYNVYKCIWNNGDAVSTVRPSGTPTSLIRTADGYIWKYMYTLNSTEVNNFLSSQFMPVKKLSANDGSAQWVVQQASVNGAIHIIGVDSGGSNYLQANGTVATVANSTVFNLAASASAIDDIYNNEDVFITGGAGSGQLRRIINYVGTTRQVTVNGAFTTTLNPTSQYRIAPRVIIKGNGTGAKAICRVNTNGSIANVAMISEGFGYTEASVIFSGNTLYGSAASATPIISPPGGHGSDPVEELGAFNTLLYARLSGNEGGTLTTGNDFREVGLIKGPRLNSGQYANATNYDLTTHLNISSNTGSIRPDDYIIGGTSKAVGYVVDANTTVIRITSSNGVFVTTETVTVANSSASAVISSVANSSIKKYTGDVVYIENRTKIIRTSTQAEEIKLLCKF